MKKLFSVFVVLVLGLAVLDIAVGKFGEIIIRDLNNTIRDGDAALANYSINSAIPDVAIIGSSTAICHYDPKLIHDSLMTYTGQDYSVFNLGVSNQRLSYNYYELKNLIDRKAPKIAIVDVWASFLSEKDKSFSFNVFRPYAKINDNIGDMLNKHESVTTKICLNSYMFCYNTEILKLVMSYFKSQGGNGFKTDDKCIDVAEVSEEIDDGQLYDISVSEFEGILKLARENNIELYIVLSPTLNSSDTLSLSYNKMKNLCKNYDVPFIDYSHKSSYMKKEFFRDHTHLNYNGAEMFTSELMSEIKNIRGDFKVQ